MICLVNGAGEIMISQFIQKYLEMFQDFSNTFILLGNKRTLFII